MECIDCTRPLRPPLVCLELSAAASNDDVIPVKRLLLMLLLLRLVKFQIHDELKYCMEK